MIGKEELLIWTMAAAFKMSGETTQMPSKLAEAIVDMSFAYPLFAGEKGPQQTAAIAIDFAWHESGYNNNLIGNEADGGHSYGAFEVRLCQPFDSCYEILHDEHKSVFLALKWLSVSMKKCGPPYFFAIYTSGSCTNRAGQNISAHRLAESRKLIRDVKLETPIVLTIPSKMEYWNKFENSL